MDLYALSRCPNARACSAWDQYDHECERGVVMQKCFVAIHRELGVLQFFAKAAAGPEALEQAAGLLRRRSGGG